VWQLVAACAEVTLRRRGPETLPDSTFLVLFLAGVDFVMSAVIELVLEGLRSWQLGILAADMAIAFVFVYAVLRFFRLERRYRQTMAALVAVDICVTLVYFIVALPGVLLHVDSEALFYWSLALGFLFWRVFIYAWIFARSLSQPWVMGLMFAILMTLISLVMHDLLIPTAAT
jgi:hypothetical protein